MNIVANFRESLYSPEVVQHYITPGETINDWLKSSGYADRLLQDPIVVILNGVELMENQYDIKLNTGDILELQQFPRGPALGPILTSFITWATYAMVAIAAIQMLTMPEPDVPSTADAPLASPTYSLSVKGNRYRPQNRGPILYGTLRIVPDFDQPPFSSYDASGDQTLHMMFKITQGEAEVDLTSILMEDTPLSNFEGVQLELVEPNVPPTLFPDGVVQSGDISNVPLTGGFSPAYAASDVGTQITRVDVDISCPGGLFYQDVPIYEGDPATGKFKKLTIPIRVFAQTIDNTGTPTGSWTQLGYDQFTGSTPDPIRRTLSYEVPLERYQIRIERITAESDLSSIGDTMVWMALRGYVHSPTNVSPNTRLAISVRASEQIGNRSLTDVSVICSRKLPTWNPDDGWSDPVQTNSIAWALADLCRSDYAGNRSDFNYDLLKLYQLDEQLTPLEHEFNAYYDTEGVSVWDALIKTGTAGRITPIDKSGFYTFVRDELQLSPVQAFTMRNIAKNSFRIEHTGVVEETADSVIVTIHDEDNDYRERDIPCALPGSSSLNPRKVTLFGVTNATRAKELGMFMAACNRYRRTMTPFETGVEGRIPFYGSKIAISHILLGKEGTTQVSGDIIAFNGVDTIRISEKVSASDYTTPYVIMVDLNGEPMNPYPVTIIEPDLLEVGGSPDWGQILIETGYKRPLFMLGEGSTYVTESKVTRVERDGQVVRIECFVDDPRPYTYGDGVTPPDPVDPVIPQPAAPVLSELEALLSGTVESPSILLSWSSKNSDRTQIQSSTDGGLTWDPIGSGYVLGNSFTDNPDPGTIIYRLAATNLFRGPWVSITVNTNSSYYDTPNNPTGLVLTEAFNGPTLKVEWDSNTQIHLVKVLISEVVKYQEYVTGHTWELSGLLAQQYGVGRAFDVRVWAINENNKLSTGYATLAVSNSAPPALDNLSVEVLFGIASINFDWPGSVPDLAGISIWKSSSNGFTPSSVNLNIDRSIDKVLKVPLDDAEVAYIRVAAVDVWGDSGLTYSGQYTVTGAGIGDIHDALFPIGAVDLQDSIISMNKMATGIRPPRVVTSLPAIDGVDFKNNDTVTLTSDGKLYRAVGGTWTADIAAVNITGQLTNSQIADLAATKVTGQLTNSQIADLAATKISGQLTNSQIADLASTKITGTLTNSQIADLAATKITGQIVSTQITDNAITSPKINAGAVIAGKIAADAVTATEIAANAITSAKISAGAVIAGKLAAGAVTAGTVAANAITATEIAAGSIITAKLAADAVTANEIAANAVTTAKLAAGSVITSKLAAGAVTANEIAANAVTATQINAGAVTTAKIAAGAVTANEIAANTITAAKIAAGAIGATQIAAGAVTADKLLVQRLGSIINEDPNFADGTAWDFTGGAQVSSTTFTITGASSNTFAVGSNLDCTAQSRKFYPIDPSRTYRISINSYSTTDLLGNGDTRGVAFGIRCYNSAGTLVETLAEFMTALPNVYTDVSFPVGAGTSLPINSTVTQMKLIVRMRTSDEGDGDQIHQVQDFKIEALSEGTLIKDGAITTDKIAANSIITGKLQVGAVTTSAADAGYNILMSLNNTTSEVTYNNTFSTMTKTVSGSTLFINLDVVFKITTKNTLSAGNKLVRYSLISQMLINGSASGLPSGAADYKEQNYHLVYMQPSRVYEYHVSTTLAYPNGSITGPVTLNLDALLNVKSATESVESGNIDEVRFKPSFTTIELKV